MNYQKIFTGREPYFVNVTGNVNYDLHYHHEIELSFCLESFYVINSNNNIYTIEKGDLLITPPICPHSILESSKKSNLLTVEFGSEFLGEYYEQILKIGFKEELYHLENTEDCNLKMLRNILYDVAQIRKKRENYPEIYIKGNLYLIAGIICKHLLNDPQNTLLKIQSDISKIDSILDYLYTNFNQHLTIKEICSRFGYSESNFYKTFKTLTGTTFHSILNQHRTDIACEYLSHTDMSVEEIAVKVGFTDTKNFGRVFKQLKKQTPSNYRKSKIDT